MFEAWDLECKNCEEDLTKHVELDGKLYCKLRSDSEFKVNKKGAIQLKLMNVTAIQFLKDFHTNSEKQFDKLREEMAKDEKEYEEDDLDA